MTPSELVEAVYQRFNSNWSATAFVHYEGHPFTEPSVDTEWVRVSVRNTGSAQATLGAVGTRKYDREFSVFVQVFTPVVAGVARAATLAQTARAIYEGVRLDDEAWMYAGEITELPVRDGYKSRQTNVEVFGIYLETK